MKKSIRFFFILLCVSAFAQNSVKPVLTQAHIDAFVKNYTTIERDLEKLGEKYDDFDVEDPSVLQMLKGTAAYKEYTAVLTKNGMGSENPHGVFTAIITGFAITAAEKEAENLPPEYRQMVLDQMAPYSQVAPQDLALVKKNYAKLAAVFES